LESLKSEASIEAVNRVYEILEKNEKEINSENIKEEISKIFITFNDFEKAMKKVQPSALREGFITKPNVTWEDIGALDNIREELQVSICDPINRYYYHY
jgi:ribosome biogenesis ATPase